MRIPFPGLLFSRKTAIVAAIILLLVSVFLIWFLFIRVPPSPIAVNIWNLTLTDYEGNEVALSKYKKKPLVATIFASWCPFCAAELAALAEAVEGSGVVVIAINRAEPTSVAKEYLEKLPAASDILFLADPDDAFYRAIQGYAMPETVFIDRKGQVYRHQHGPFDKPEQIAGHFVDFLSVNEKK